MNEIAWRKVKSLPTKTNTRFKLNYIPRATTEFQLTKLQRSKAAGPDNLPTGLLQESAKEISSSLCYTINRSTNTGVFPSSRKIAKVTSVYKSGCVKDIENYRPVSILSVVSKVMEKEVINNFQFTSKKRS